jgi:hypothetical protein
MYEGHRIEMSPFLMKLQEKTTRQARAVARFRDAGFSRRASNALVRGGIDEPERLPALTAADLRCFPGVGKVVLGEIAAWCERHASPAAAQDSERLSSPSVQGSKPANSPAVD